MDEILLANPYNRDFISNKLDIILNQNGLSNALNILFLQQIESGFVLFDPTRLNSKNSKKFLDTNTGVRFVVNWNPTRELRGSHQLLVEKGIIDNTVDQNKLINKDSNNKPCYLCRDNILLQNPLEILLPLLLSESQYYCGANFAPISNNHFTIMASEHIPQTYSSEVLYSMIDFVEKTNGNYKAIFNGKAGASILSHLHMQSTSDKLPIEDIKINDNDILFVENGLKVIKPFYYLPIIIVEGEVLNSVADYTDKIISDWISNEPDNNTQNLVVSKERDAVRVYIILRDRRKLVGEGKKGAMGTFECAGNLVLSYRNMDELDSHDERYLFNNINLDKIIYLLKQISPSDIAIHLDSIFGC